MACHFMNYLCHCQKARNFQSLTMMIFARSVLMVEIFCFVMVAFHTECIDLPSVPNGDWYCPYCQNLFDKEKLAERNADALAAGRVSGVDPIEQITNRCIRIVKTQEIESGGCVLCRKDDFGKSGFGPRTVLLCNLCEKEYNVGCLKDHKMRDLQELPRGKWFCCADCNRIHAALQKLLHHRSEKSRTHFQLL